jgi:hypothetical protein
VVSPPLARARPLPAEAVSALGRARADRYLRLDTSHGELRPAPRDEEARGLSTVLTTQENLGGGLVSPSRTTSQTYAGGWVVWTARILDGTDSYYWSACISRGEQAPSQRMRVRSRECRFRGLSDGRGGG